MLRSILRPLAALAALVGLAAYATIMLRGPQGLSALAEKRRQVRELEEKNANLMRDIEAQKQRIERLRHDRSTQELEVRKRLKLQRPGDTSFVIPDAPNASGTGNPAGVTRPDEPK
ncbi:MAG: FtsB family cell division protein [Bryobacteraceae bacterium]